jgi:hypothetical protein
MAAGFLVDKIRGRICRLNLGLWIHGSGLICSGSGWVTTCGFSEENASSFERLADVAAFLCKLAKLSNSGALMQHRKSSSPCLVAGDVVPVGRCDGSQRPVVIGEQRSQFGLYQFRDCRHDLAVPAGTGPQCGEGNAGEDGRSLVGKTKQNRRGIPGVNNYGWSEIQTRFT